MGELKVRESNLNSFDINSFASEENCVNSVKAELANLNVNNYEN
jgi:hypothetical protein